MLLTTLALRDFRNLARLDLTVPDAGVVVIGENGQGKTNLLEAIYYLHLLRSVRGARDVDVVRFGAPGFHIAARTGGGPHHELSAGFERQGRRKRVKLDGGEPPRLSDALGALPCVLFSRRRGARGRRAECAASISRHPAGALVAPVSRRAPALSSALAQRNAALRDALKRGRKHGAARRRVGSAARRAWRGALARARDVDRSGGRSIR